MDKLVLHTYCLDILDMRIAQYSALLKDIDAALADDSKSSAGDKYETSREMLRQEYDKTDRLIVNARQDKSKLEQMSPALSSTIVGLGSMVRADIGWLYIAVALGKVAYSEKTVFVISPDCPMAQAIIGRSSQDMVEVNGRKVRLLEVI